MLCSWNTSLTVPRRSDKSDVEGGGGVSNIFGPKVL